MAPLSLLNPFWVYPTRGSILLSHWSDPMRGEAQKKFRGLLVAARKKAELTQAELVSHLNRPQSFVSKYERAYHSHNVRAEKAAGRDLQPFRPNTALVGEHRD